MNKQEFKREFKSLHARFPGFVMPEPEMVEKIYFGELNRFPLKVFQAAIPDIITRSPQYFPTAGIVKAACEAVELSARALAKDAKWRFEPLDHGCNISGEMTYGGVRAMLHAASPYEAMHVKCRVTTGPVCPQCGKVQDPQNNPIIEFLMREYPDDTECWDPHHKGTLLCPSCDHASHKLRFPQGEVTVP